MRHVEHVLKLLEPSFNVRRIAARRKRRENPLFRRGTIFRAVLDVLRAADGPMTVDAISRTLYRAKGIEEPTRDQMRDMYGAVASSLGNHVGQSVGHDADRPKRWTLLRRDA